MTTETTTYREQWDRIDDMGFAGALDNSGYIHTRESYIEAGIDMDAPVEEPVYGYGGDRAPLGDSFCDLLTEEEVEAGTTMQPTNLADIREAMAVQSE